MQKYLDLLYDCKVAADRQIADDEAPVVTPLPSLTLKCCDDIVEDLLNGCMVCCGCGLVVENKIYIYHQPYAQRSNFANQMQRPLGSSGHVTFNRKRFYQPLTHFKEHLRRYMGARFTTIDENVLEKVRGSVLNLQDSNAHQMVKSVLKQHRHTHLYKEIFTIIYLCGGQPPHLDSKVYESCIEDFKKLMFHFMKCRSQWQRHSMPSMYMLLDMLLRVHGHEPHYKFPHLKNMRLRQQVLDIYSSLRQSSTNLSNLYIGFKNQ